MGSVGCESTAAVHFSPSFCPIAGLLGCKSGKNCPRWGRFSLSTPQVRQAPSLSTSRFGFGSTRMPCSQSPGPARAMRSPAPKPGAPAAPIASNMSPPRTRSNASRPGETRAVARKSTSAHGRCFNPVRTMAWSSIMSMRITLGSPGEALQRAEAPKSEST